MLNKALGLDAKIEKMNTAKGVSGRASRYPGYFQVPGADTEFVPNHTGEFGTVSRPYRTLPKSSVECLPSKYLRYTLVRKPTEDTLENLEPL